MINLKKLTLAVSFAVVGLSAPAVMAENNAPAPTGAAVQQQGQATVRDAALRKFMQASVEVSRIREDYPQRLNNAKDQPIAQKLQQEAQDKMIGAVEATGFDAASYTELAERIQASPELQSRMQELQ